MKKIKIFLASSNELKDERDQFRLFIGLLNDKFIDRGIYLEVIQWEHFLDAISNTRLQDEYNEALRKADIALCIFFTKVGRYSEEEFNTAYTNFKATGKPRIWTYFKDAPIPIGAITNEIKTLLAFKEKLNGLGHFCTSYTSSADLHNKFRDQLDRVYPDLINPPKPIPPGGDSESKEKPTPVDQGKAPITLSGKDEVLQLIDLDIVAAFERLDGVYLNKNATYNDLSREFFSRPENFSLSNFRSKLKRFIAMTWK